MSNTTAYADRPYVKALRNAAPKATENQINFILKLTAEHGKKAPTQEQIDSWSKKKASEIITWFLKQPKPVAAAPVTAAPKVDVPDGYYAIETLDIVEDAANEINFYRVRTVTEEGNRWFGFTFVDHIVSETTYPVKGASKAKVLQAIAHDPAEASRRYGRETQTCGVCHRNLTNDESRAAGIGPRCRDKMEW